MATYIVQAVDYHGYGLRATIETTVSGLTVPASPTLILTTPISEKVSGMPSVGEIANVDFEVVEDYDSEREGFWYKMLSNDNEPLIQLDMNEGSGYRYYFYGYVIPETVKVVDVYIRKNESEANVCPHRKIGFSCVSFFVKSYKSVTIDDCVTEILSHETAADTQGCKFVKVHEICASIHKLATGQSFTTNDIVTDGDPIKFHNASPLVTDKTFGELYVCTLNDSAVRTPFFDSAHDNYFGKSYVSGFELFKDICINFGYVPRYYYDSDVSRHKIELLTLGKSAAGDITIDGDLQTSTSYFSNQYGIKNLQTSALGSLAVLLEHPGYVVSETSGLADVLYTTISKAFEFDANIRCVFSDCSDYDTNSAGTSPSGAEVLGLESAGRYVALNKINFWDYGTGTYRNQTIASVCGALAFYYYGRFRLTRPRRSLYCTYHGITATRSGVSSHNNLRIGQTVSISDGFSSRTFYAAEVSKDIVNNRTEVVWNEV